MAVWRSRCHRNQLQSWRRPTQCRSGKWSPPWHGEQRLLRLRTMMNLLLLHLRRQLWSPSPRKRSFLRRARSRCIWRSTRWSQGRWRCPCQNGHTSRSARTRRDKLPFVNSWSSWRLWMKWCLLRSPCSALMALAIFRWREQDLWVGRTCCNQRLVLSRECTLAITCNYMQLPKITINYPKLVKTWQSNIML